MPGHFQVIRHVRPKYPCDAITQAPAPAMPTPRGRAAPGLLSHLLVGKFCDHLPLYRQSEIYAREGLDLDRSTLSDWVGQGDDLGDGPATRIIHGLPPQAPPSGATEGRSSGANFRRFPQPSLHVSARPLTSRRPSGQHPIQGPQDPLPAHLPSQRRHIQAPLPPARAAPGASENGPDTGGPWRSTARTIQGEAGAAGRTADLSTLSGAVDLHPHAHPAERHGTMIRGTRRHPGPILPACRSRAALNAAAETQLFASAPSPGEKSKSP